MAKALFGHVGTDLRLVSEVARLRSRVRDLEEELAQLRAGSVIALDEAVSLTGPSLTLDTPVSASDLELLEVERALA